MSDLDETLKAIKYTPEEMERAVALIREATEAAVKFVHQFSSDTKGMMLFLVALAALKDRHEGIFDKTDKAAMLLLEWVGAGEPEDPAEVPPRMKQRLKEAYERRRAE
jgi:hypothetical protein